VRGSLRTILGELELPVRFEGLVPTGRDDFDPVVPGFDVVRRGELVGLLERGVFESAIQFHTQIRSLIGVILYLTANWCSSFRRLKTPT